MYAFKRRRPHVGVFFSLSFWRFGFLAAVSFFGPVVGSTLEESWVLVEGYSSFFTFPRRLSGYSGVATFCKDAFRPLAAEEGLSGLWTPVECHDALGYYGNNSDVDEKHLRSIDGEGRALLTLHEIR